MFGVLFIFFSFITLLNAQLCPASNGTANIENCVLVPGCNYDNGSLTALATQCSNELSDNDCQQLFPCASPCDQSSTGGTAGTSTTYPYVRAPACLNPNLRDIALQCK